MAYLDEYLRQSASRLQREPWSDPNRLAQELYSIFGAAPEANSGALSIDLGSSVRFNTNDAPDIALPLIDFDALTPDGVLAPQETELKGEDNQQTDQSRIFRRRTVLLARVVSRQSTGLFTCRIYPDGPTSNFETVADVAEVAGRDVADGTWVLIARIDTCRYVVTSLTEGNSINQTRIELLSRLHFFAEGNSPRAYAPWGSGAGLNESPGLPRILTLRVQINDSDGATAGGSYLNRSNALLWRPDDRVRTFSSLETMTIGNVGPVLGSVTLTFDPVAGTIRMAFTGGTLNGYSVSQDAYTWATSAAVGTLTPGGVGVMSWPATAYQTGTPFNGADLHADVKSKWTDLGAHSGGSFRVYARVFLKF